MNMPRNIALDITKGIAIILVILGHSYQIPYMPWRHFIFSFHMPLFFLVSGYFYRPKTIKESMIKDFKHLMIPYFVTCAAIVLFYSVTGLRSGDFEKLQYYFQASAIGSGGTHDGLVGGGVPFIGAIWFLPALLVCKNVYNMLPVKGRLLYSLGIFLLATIVGRYFLFVPFSVLCGLSAIIFYAIGDILKSVERIPWYFWIVGLICWGCSLAFSGVYIVNPQMDLYIIDVMGATTASILVYLLSKQISKVPVLSSTLSWIGCSSLYILCLHCIDLDCELSRRLSILLNVRMTNWFKIILPLCGAFALYWVKKKSRVKVCQV